jgi:1-acyl-sn-glycerol-3-phosphate acyltransferase
MIAANHKKWADWLFQPYLNWLFRRHFYAIHLFDPIPEFDIHKPLLLLPNHSSWWDGFFIYLVNKKILRRKTYLMMLEEQLRQNRFFRFLGVYSVKSDTYKDVKDSIQYTIHLLTSKEKPLLVCLFPQGELLSWHLRPIEFKRGLEFILKRTNATLDLCFLGLRIEFLAEQRPEVFMQFSPIKKIRPQQHYPIAELESEFTSFMDRFGEKIVDGEKGQMIFQGKKSVNEQFHAYLRRGR